METGLTIFIAGLIAIVGTLLGFRVQKVTKFIIPYDFISLGILGLVFINTIFDFIPAVNSAFHWAFMGGYVLGNILSSMRSFTLIVTLPEPTRITTEWAVFYEGYDGKTYIADQSQRALIERLIFRNPHEVIFANGTFDDRFFVEFTYPFFPIMSGRSLLIESEKTFVDVSESRFWTHKRYTTKYILADGHTASKVELLYDFNKMTELQEQNVRQIEKIHRMEREVGPTLLERSLAIDCAMTESRPANRMLAYAKKLTEFESVMDEELEQKPKKKKKKESATDGLEKESD